MRRFFLTGLCLLIMGLISSAHQPDKGIEWATGLTFQQVREKARNENKYIFLDCFATWCGPCKEMDKVVYANDTVGSFFNERFISVKVQMDKTQKDDDLIKSWYADAEAISDQYRVLTFPTYLFLAPDGRIVHKDEGYKAVDKFIATATTALMPGQIYVDKYGTFDKLEAEYRIGRKDYNRMLYMIQAAEELNKNSFARNLKKDYLAYLEGLKKKQLYTKENLLFLGNQVALKSSSPLFDIFYSEGKKVDKVVGERNYAMAVVGRVVYREITVPLLNLRPKMNIIGGKRDSAEADWEGVYTKIREKFSKEYAKLGLLEAKLTWYEQHFNYLSFYSTYIQKLKTYGFDTLSVQSNTNHPYVNFHCWRIFLSLDDQLLLAQAARQMRKLAKQKQMSNQYLRMQSMDTYANLLYKTGKKARAIHWEARAFALATKMQDVRHMSICKTVLSKMRAGKPTWPIK